MLIQFKKQAPTEILRFGIDYLRLNFDKDFPGVFFDSLYQGLSQNSTEIFYNIMASEIAKTEIVNDVILAYPEQFL